MHVHDVIGTAVGFLLGGSIAQAEPAWTLTNIKIMVTPTAQARVIGEIPKGSKIDIGDCTDGWCSLTWGGRKAFVLQGYLLKDIQPAELKPLFPR